MVSRLPRKQRKARYNANNTKRRHQMAAQIDPELRDKMRARKVPIYYPRSLPVRRGDRVRVVRGGITLRDKPRGKANKITGVDTRRRKIFVEGKTYRKADSSEVPRAIDPSNVIIINPDWSDPARRKLLTRLNPETDLIRKEIELAEDEYEAGKYEVEEGFGEEDYEEQDEAFEEEDLDEQTEAETVPEPEAEVEAEPAEPQEVEPEGEVLDVEPEVEGETADDNSKEA